MEQLTEKAPGCFEYRLKDHKAAPCEFSSYDAFFDYSMAVKRLAAYEDTGLEPEEIKGALNEDAVLKMAARVLNTTPDRLRELAKAQDEGRLALDEKTALAMAAGARAIENNKRLSGATYGWDIFGECGGPKEISYFKAAKRLREISGPILTRAEAEAALSVQDTTTL